MQVDLGPRLTQIDSYHSETQKKASRVMLIHKIEAQQFSLLSQAQLNRCRSYRFFSFYFLVAVLFGEGAWVTVI